MAGGTVARTPHFALHRLAFSANSAAIQGHPETGSGSEPQPLFIQPGVWLGAMVPKRWARRAVTQKKKEKKKKKNKKKKKKKKKEKNKEKKKKKIKKKRKKTKK